MIQKYIIQLVVSLMLTITLFLVYVKYPTNTAIKESSISDISELTIANDTSILLNENSEILSVEQKSTSQQPTANESTSVIENNVITGENYMGISLSQENQQAYLLNSEQFRVQTNPNYAIQGIDVSMWQGTIDWNQVKNGGFTFAYIKSTEGTGYTDPKWNNNIRNGKNSGIFVGAYHFARPDKNANAANEANWFASVIAPYQHTGYLRPVLDLEVSTGYSWESLSAWTETFMTTFIANTGIEPIIYINSNYANNLSSYLNKYDLWIAHWGVTTPNDGRWNSWEIWQYGGTPVPGISGSVDGNVYFGDANQLYSRIIIDPIQPGSCKGEYCFNQPIADPVFPPELGICDPDFCP